MRPIPRQRLLHHLAEGVAAIDLVVAEALQHHELLGLAGARIHGFALLRRHQPVVVGGDEQDRARRDALSGLKPSVSSMNSSGTCVTAAGLSRRAAAPNSADWRSGSSTSLRSPSSELPVSARLTRSAAARSSRSWYSSGRRTLRIQRAPLPMPTTETTHLTRGSMAATNTTVAPP